MRIPPGPPLDDGELPIQFDEYERRVVEAYAGLLERQSKESVLQAFLEQHPAMLPGAFPEHGGHGAFLEAAISQPRLPGTDSRVPDFLLLARHSVAVTPVFVELEQAGKRWATGGDRPRQHSDLSQPLSQLDEWREWLRDGASRSLLWEAFELPVEWQHRQLSPIYVLIHGRRTEGAHAQRIRARLRRPDRWMLTHDHLRPHPWMKDYLCLKRRPGGGFDCVHMSPTARLTPNRSEDWLRLHGVAEMVQRCAWISTERREYLLSMVPQWDEWAAQDAGHWRTFHEDAQRVRREAYDRRRQPGS